MKFNLLTILCVSVLMFSGLWTIAQPPGGRGGFNMPPEERAQLMSDRINDALTLTEEQYEMIYAINLETAVQMSETMQSANGDREAMRAKMMELRKGTNDRIKEVLTPEQLTTYQELQRNRRQGRQGPPEEGKKKRKGPKGKKKAKQDTDTDS
ncbi:MAG: hypothetical protein AAF587_03045 [Bacteroidota bacterium]